MEDISKKLKSERLKRNLTIAQVSEMTKIRPYVLEALESGDLSVMPPVYVKSFIKTYSEFLELKNIDLDIKSENIDNVKIHEEINIIKPEKIKSDLKPEKHEKLFQDKIIFDTDSNSKSDYAKIFNKKTVNPGFHPNIINYIIYASVALVLVVIVYFTFFYTPGSNAFSANSSNGGDKLDTVNVGKKDGLFSYFEKSDSLTVSAKAQDTAWLKIEIDGNESEELLMTPPMEKSWTANEYILISQGNVGSIEFSRNGTVLPIFGKKGTVVKNVKITREEVLNISPWQTDTVGKSSTIRKRRKKTEETQIRRIEPSNIEANRPAILEGSNKR